jgi:hypothetical protein
MTTVVVLFNLKPDADPRAYEAWARATDLPPGLRNDTKSGAMQRVVSEFRQFAEAPLFIVAEPL